MGKVKVIAETYSYQIRLHLNHIFTGGLVRGELGIGRFPVPPSPIPNRDYYNTDANGNDIIYSAQSYCFKNIHLPRENCKMRAKVRA